MDPRPLTNVIRTLCDVYRECKEPDLKTDLANCISELQDLRWEMRIGSIQCKGEEPWHN